MACEKIESGYGVQVKACPSLKKVERRLKKARNRMKDSRSPFKASSIILDRWVQKNFKSEGKSAGGWKAFAPDNKRKLLDPSAKLLQDTGRLRSSFIPFAYINNAGIGSNLKYSKPHEEGLGPLPPRRMLPERDDVWPDIKKIFTKHILDSFK